MSDVKPARRFSLAITISRKRCGRAAAYHREQTSRHLRVTTLPQPTCVTFMSSQKSSRIYSWSSNGSSNGFSEKHGSCTTFIRKPDKLLTSFVETGNPARRYLEPCFRAGCSIIGDSAIALRLVRREHGAAVNTHRSSVCSPAGKEGGSTLCLLRTNQVYICQSQRTIEVLTESVPFRFDHPS